MVARTIFVLASSNVTVSGGEQLSGITQGEGTHLLGLTITLNNNSWEQININDTTVDSGNGPPPTRRGLEFTDNDTGQRLAGAQSLGGQTYANNLIVENEYAITVTDGTNFYQVIAFNIREPGSPESYSTIEGLAFVGGVGGFPPIGVPLTVVSNEEFPSDPYANLASPPCFVSGTRLLTPDGYRRVDDLSVDDWVSTLDHGTQQIRWIGVARLPKAVLVQSPKFRPVVIHKGAFGPDCPTRDVQVSPQHRVLITGWQAELLFGEPEVLVPAIKLVNDRSIRALGPDQDVTYYHVMFDRHEIVWADGLASESFLPGLVGNSDAADTQAELDALFPDMAAEWVRSFTARPCISDKRTHVLRAFLPS